MTARPLAEEFGERQRGSWVGVAVSDSLRGETRDSWVHPDSRLTGFLCRGSVCSVKLGSSEKVGLLLGEGLQEGPEVPQNGGHQKKHVVLVTLSQQAGPPWTRSYQDASRRSCRSTGLPGALTGARGQGCSAQWLRGRCGGFVKLPRKEEYRKLKRQSSAGSHCRLPLQAVLYKMPLNPASKALPCLPPTKARPS